jgi:hypothetical protein
MVSNALKVQRASSLSAVSPHLLSRIHTLQNENAYEINFDSGYTTTSSRIELYMNKTASDWLRLNDSDSHILNSYLFHVLRSFMSLRPS